MRNASKNDASDFEEKVDFFFEINGGRSNHLDSVTGSVWSANDNYEHPKFAKELLQGM